MPTAFSEIIARQSRPALYRTDSVVAFLSNRPIRPGHALVVPTAEIDSWQDVSDIWHADIIYVAKIVAAAQKRLYAPKRIGLIAAGFEVPHYHLHVIPADSLEDLHITHDIPRISEEAIVAETKRLLNHI